MKANEGKCRLVVSARCHKTINVWDAEIKSSDCENFFRMKIDLPLNFEGYFSVLSRMTSYMSSCIHFSRTALVTAHLFGWSIVAQ